MKLLKREAGSRLTQPGVSATPTRHSLTVGPVKENTTMRAEKMFVVSENDDYFYVKYCCVTERNHSEMTEK